MSRPPKRPHPGHVSQASSVQPRGDPARGPVRKSGQMPGWSWAPLEAVGVPGLWGRRLGLPASYLLDGWRRRLASLSPLGVSVRPPRACVHVGAIPSLVSVAPQALRVSPHHGCSRHRGPVSVGHSGKLSAPSGRPPALGAALSFRREKTLSPAPGCLPEAFPALQWFWGTGSPRGACTHPGSL